MGEQDGAESNYANAAPLCAATVLDGGATPKPLAQQKPGLVPHQQDKAFIVLLYHIVGTTRKLDEPSLIATILRDR